MNRRANLVLAAILFLIASPVLACSCVALSARIAAMPVEQRNIEVRRTNFARAKYVIRVKVTESTKISTGYTMQVNVLESMKGGKSIGPMVVQTGISSCALPLEKGEEWLLFLEETLIVGFCMGNTALDPNDPDSNATLTFVRALSKQVGEQ